MPSCRPDVIPAILYRLMEMVPGTILDVGAGHGKWGVLCSEYLTYWRGVRPVIDGIEVFEGYRSPAYGVYRNVISADAMSVLNLVGCYDLVLMVDVIEHLSRDDGERLLGAVSNRYLVSTPLYWSAQRGSFGNEREAHLSRWTADDFDHSEVVVDRVGRRHVIGWR